MDLITIFSDKENDLLKDESRMSGYAQSISFPRSTEDVSQILKSTDQKVTIQGNRTGLAGGAVPYGGHILNITRMTKILSLEDNIVHCQAGLLLSDLTKHLKEFGLFLPPDPTEKSACLGGMAACNASGARTLRYGPIRPWIIGLTVVMSDGEIIEINRGEQFASGYDFTLITKSGKKISSSLPKYEMPNVKNAAGLYIHKDMDLIDLFIGSEGTLGVITELKLKLLSLPRRIAAVTSFFATEKSALDFVDSTRKSNINPAALEYFDENSLEMLRTERQNNPSFIDLQELPENYYSAVYIEIHASSKQEQDKMLSKISDLIVDCGGNSSHTWLAITPSDFDNLQYFRHATPEIVNLTIDRRRKEYPGLTKLGTDMAVPDNKLYDVMNLYRTDLEKANLEYVIFGHIGDNHVHVNIIPRNDAEYELGKALYLDWSRQIVSWGGTVSAEHGIGKFKINFLKMMYSEDDLNEMIRVKKLLDSKLRLNIGNLFEVGEAK
jgi:D-lactate dehydrogenase (cytochrome)